MNLEKNGTHSSRNIKNKLWWMKLSIALVVSNIFFYLIFTSDQAKGQPLRAALTGALVEAQLEAQLLTPFQSGKKVLIIQRERGLKIEGVLQGLSTEVPGRVTVLVKENEASALFFHRDWEILPFLRELTLVTKSKGGTHEIRY